MCPVRYPTLLSAATITKLGSPASSSCFSSWTEIRASPRGNPLYPDCPAWAPAAGRNRRNESARKKRAVIFFIYGSFQRFPVYGGRYTIMSIEYVKIKFADEGRVPCIPDKPIADNNW